MDQAIQDLIDSVRKPGCCYESATIRQLRPLLEELVLRRREDSKFGGVFAAKNPRLG
jgi:hypothetical protein